MGVIYHFTVLCKVISVLEYVDKTYLMCHFNVITFLNININNCVKCVHTTICTMFNVQELRDGGGGGRLSAGLKWAVLVLKCANTKMR